MLQSEDNNTAALNEAGCLAATTALKQFDTRGLGDWLWQREIDPHGHYHTTYPTRRGEAGIERHWQRPSVISSPIKPDALCNEYSPAFTDWIGMTETACKTLIKQRLGNSGRRWKEKGAAAVISLSTLAHTRLPLGSVPGQDWPVWISGGGVVWGSSNS